MFEVLESAKRISETSNRVRIDGQALVRFARDWLSEGVEVPVWDNVHHFVGGGAETVSYLLVLDSLNFCFWPAIKSHDGRSNMVRKAFPATWRWPLH